MEVMEEEAGLTQACQGLALGRKDSERRWEPSVVAETSEVWVPTWDNSEISELSSAVLSWDNWEAAAVTLLVFWAEEAGTWGLCLVEEEEEQATSELFWEEVVAGQDSLDLWAPSAVPAGICPLSSVEAKVVWLDWELNWASWEVWVLSLEELDLVVEILAPLWGNSEEELISPPPWDSWGTLEEVWELLELESAVEISRVLSEEAWEANLVSLVVSLASWVNWANWVVSWDSWAVNGDSWANWVDWEEASEAEALVAVDWDKLWADSEVVWVSRLAEAWDRASEVDKAALAADWRVWDRASEASEAQADCLKALVALVASVERRSRRSRRSRSTKPISHPSSFSPSLLNFCCDVFSLHNGPILTILLTLVGPHSIIPSFLL